MMIPGATQSRRAATRDCGFTPEGRHLYQTWVRFATLTSTIHKAFELQSSPLEATVPPPKTSCRMLCSVGGRATADADANERGLSSVGVEQRDFDQDHARKSRRNTSVDIRRDLSAPPENTTVIASGCQDADIMESRSGDGPVVVRRSTVSVSWLYKST